MKRLLIWVLTTVFAVLSGGPAIAAMSGQPALQKVSAVELAEVTGGRCFVKCEDEEEEDDEPVVVDYVWRKVSQRDAAPQQLAYEIYTEISNVYGNSPIDYSVTVNDQCRYRWVSGGFGISQGFSVQIGRTYSCEATARLAGVIAPGYRLKIYKGDMQQYTTVTMAEFEVYSDGSSRETGARDTGRRERRWNRFTPVPVYGN